MPDMTKKWAHIKCEIDQMRQKATSARIEILKLEAIAQTCDHQAQSLEWALKQELEKGQ